MLGLQLGDDLRRAIRRPVVDHDDLVGGYGLRERGEHARPDRELLVEGGDDDEDGFLCPCSHNVLIGA